MIAKIRWIDAICGRNGACGVEGYGTYLWGGPSNNGDRIGDAGKPERTFEFREINGDLVDEQLFFMLLWGRMHMCQVAKKYGMYAKGGHIYPLHDGPKYEIVREIHDA